MSSKWATNAAVYCLILGSLLGVMSVSCCTLTLGQVRLSPHHNGVDSSFKVLVGDYIDLAKEQKIFFKRSVSVGFEDINDDAVIGLCHYGVSFREIDIDSAYWKRATAYSKRILVYHELTHCYCGRDHDYAAGKIYPEHDRPQIASTRKNPVLEGFQLSSNNGYFDDGCPITIMHPVIVEDYCARIHYSHYISEMFERCEAY